MENNIFTLNSDSLQWSNIVESMNAGILIVDNNGTIMYSNKAFCNLTGYELEEMQGKVASDLFLTDQKNKEIIKSNIADRKNNLSGKYEIEIRTKSGKYLWINISGSPYKDKDGNVIGSIGIQSDITKLKETEKAVGMARVGSWMVSFRTGVAEWSEEALRMYGIPITEREQTFDSWISHIHPDDLEDFKKEIEKSQATFSDLSYKHRILLKDGSVRYIHSVSKHEFNESGEHIGLYGICHDITDQIKAEKALESTNKELETFIYKASHDIRGPLASIIGLINVSKLEVKEPTALNYLNMIDSATKKLDHVLVELVKAMKIKGTESFGDEINFATLFSDVLSRFEHTPGYAHLRISTSINVTKPFLSNKFILETILQNLIENAIKYQNAKINHSFLKINVQESSRGIIITLEDNGIGIEQKLQSRVFDMYFRAIEDAKGSGLGLYLVKRGIEKLNGKIELESRLGEGSTFTVTLSAN